MDHESSSFVSPTSSQHEIMDSTSSAEAVPLDVSSTTSDETVGKRNGAVLRGWVRLNVGGKIFQTTRTTLMRDTGSFLYRISQEEGGLLTDKDETGAYLIDRDAEFFSPILNYLRHGKLIINPGMSEEGLLEEAEFYNLRSLCQMITEKIAERDGKKSNTKFVYRVLQCQEEELTSVVSAMSDSWKIVQVVPMNNSVNYAADSQQEYLCIVERECPDIQDASAESQDRAKLLQQRARHN